MRKLVDATYSSEPREHFLTFAERFGTSGTCNSSLPPHICQLLAHRFQTGLGTLKLFLAPLVALREVMRLLECMLVQTQVVLLQGFQLPRANFEEL